MSKNFSDAHFSIIFSLTEFWFFLQSVLIAAAIDNIFFFAACCLSSGTCSWSDSSCQISCVWTETESVSHSDTDQVRKWMSLFSALKLRLFDKYQSLSTSSCSECLSIWLQNLQVWSFCFFVFLTVMNVKWLLCELMLIWWLHCRFDEHWQK